MVILWIVNFTEVSIFPIFTALLKTYMPYNACCIKSGQLLLEADKNLAEWWWNIVATHGRYVRSSPSLELCPLLTNCSSTICIASIGPLIKTMRIRQWFCGKEFQQYKHSEAEQKPESSLLFPRYQGEKLFSKAILALKHILWLHSRWKKTKIPRHSKLWCCQPHQSRNRCTGGCNIYIYIY